MLKKNFFLTETQGTIYSLMTKAKIMMANNESVPIMRKKNSRIKLVLFLSKMFNFLQLYGLNEIFFSFTEMLQTKKRKHEKIIDKKMLLHLLINLNSNFVFSKSVVDVNSVKILSKSQYNVDILVFIRNLLLVSIGQVKDLCKIS